MRRPYAAVSIVDPPDVEPALTIVFTTLHGKSAAEVVDLATARKLISEMQGALDAIERSRSRGRT